MPLAPVLIVLALDALPRTSAWVASTQGVRLAHTHRLVPARMNMRPPENEGDGNLPESGVDWDRAWMAELEKRKAGASGWRPEGREAVTSEQVTQAKAKRAADDMTLTLQQASSDWRFWMATIAFISVATAILGQPTSEGFY